MSRKSQETIGPNVDIPATTESNARASRVMVAETVVIRPEPADYESEILQPNSERTLSPAAGTQV